MKKQQVAIYAIFWPAYMSAAWMAGVILAFACHLRLYSPQKGRGEIALCLEVLAELSARWSLARNCHIVLTDLLQMLQQNTYSLQQTSPLSGFPSMSGVRFRSRTRDVSQSDGGSKNDDMRTAKRRRNASDVLWGFSMESCSGLLQSQLDTKPQTGEREGDQLSNVMTDEPLPTDNILDDHGGRVPRLLREDEQPHTGLVEHRLPQQQQHQQQQPTRMYAQNEPLSVAPSDSAGANLMALPTLGWDSILLAAGL
ncbi:hypothetical protein S40293_09882 [Stachybotrys chartarum IBT 40293]|nr:hypothetical protein S40293_09882 [Stachybotrys chartarum IBT 40293]